MASRELAPGERIRVRFGGRVVTGTVTSVSGHRVHVELDIEGASEPLDALYRDDQLVPA